MNRTQSSRKIKVTRLSLVWQLGLLAVLPALLAMGLLLALSMREYVNSAEIHIRRQAQTLAQQVAVLAQGPMATEDKRALLRLAQATMSQPYIQQVQIWSYEGELLTNVETADLRREAGLRVSSPVFNSSGGEPGTITVERGLEDLYAAQRRAWTNILLAVALSLAAVLMAGIWAARRISSPVRKLADAVDRLAAGEPVQVDIVGAGEVQHLQEGFNKAAKELHDSRELLEERVREATAELAEKNRVIEQVSQAKTRLLAAASHDLRQPLHALVLFSEGLAQAERDPVQCERIRQMRECVDSLDQLFAELLNISQIDAGVLRPQRSDFSLNRLFDHISRNFRPVAEAQHLRLVVRHTDLWVNSDYFMLSRIVGNLVANAVNYTRTGGILVAARRRGAIVRIDVVDTGIGIAPDHQQRIFDEYYQVNAGENALGRGLGLGLATVQRLTTLLGLHLTLKSVPGQGSWFQIEVPLVSAAAEPASRTQATPAVAETTPIETAASSTHALKPERSRPRPSPRPSAA
ncbi:sensor histidine kinase [Ottowia caeni]|uniref:sensor histidine kinase n=1 Tax=Ottowia caeni TaxID=2870339 RepID=UPI001E2D1986|nr:HAMP domain-containing histidine kinase [Ottowia caeni]